MKKHTRVLGILLAGMMAVSTAAMVPANAATITGNAGSAFCNFNAIGDLKADASVGCNAKAGNIIALTYYVSYTGSAMSYTRFDGERGVV